MRYRPSSSKVFDPLGTLPVNKRISVSFSLYGSGTTFSKHTLFFFSQSKDGSLMSSTGRCGFSANFSGILRVFTS